MLQTRNVYILLFSLYWAQGLPVGFMTHALPVILRAQGVSLAHIGGFWIVDAAVVNQSFLGTSMWIVLGSPV